jgi:hypothetical protein
MQNTYLGVLERDDILTQYLRVNVTMSGEGRAINLV